MAAPTAAAYLEVSTGTGTHQHALVGNGPITVGRQAGNTIVLADNMSSRQHCVIERTPEGYRVRDLGSRNGTRLNGIVVQQSKYGPGDAIQIGTSRIVYVDAPEELTSLDALEDVVEDMVEPLTADDVVEVETPPTAAQAQADPGEYEQVLEITAESMADKPFGEYDIALVNTRGQVQIPAGAPKRKVQRREPIDILRMILLITFRSRATDIHVEAKTEFYQVRLRADGVMVDCVKMPVALGVKVMAAIKILCELDPTQRSSVQEGQFSAQLPGRKVDFRISFAPAVYGQKLVMRVLDEANSPLRLGDLKLPPLLKRDVENAIQQESGMILVCGPTGSGKTTSLYALIRSMDLGERNVITIEDPVEIRIEGVTQLPVDDSGGKSFSTLLKSVLRQDPDVILVGEIRDAETARIAMQASITGHLVFSTLHTQNSIGTVFRLLDLGIEPYLLAQGLHVIIAQRLVRNLCPFCKREVKPTQEQLERMGQYGKSVTATYVQRGCPRCMGTGFSGRRAFFEVLSTTEAFREMMHKNPSPGELVKTLDPAKFLSLSDAGFKLVAEGLTSFDEIDKAVGR